MPFLDTLPAYTIDLAKPAAERWQRVVARDSRVARRVADAALADLRVVRPAGALFDQMYRRLGGHYGDELDLWARALGALRGARTLDDVATTLDHPPVLNDQSYQQMAFCPKTGDVRVWRWV